MAQFNHGQVNIPKWDRISWNNHDQEDSKKYPEGSFTKTPCILQKPDSCHCFAMTLRVFLRHLHLIHEGSRLEMPHMQHVLSAQLEKAWCFLNPDDWLETSEPYPNSHSYAAHDGIPHQYWNGIIVWRISEMLDLVSVVDLSQKCFSWFHISVLIIRMFM